MMTQLIYRLFPAGVDNLPNSTRIHLNFASLLGRAVVRLKSSLLRYLLLLNWLKHTLETIVLKFINTVESITTGVLIILLNLLTN